MSVKFFIGMDPGSVSGAIAIIGGPRGPETWPFKNMTLAEIWNVISVRDGATLAALERVSSMPRQGVSSTFKFGASYGSLEAFLVAAEIPYELVPPGTWQKKLGCLTRGDKKVTRKKAQQLFPQVKVTHAVADALLIAEYARRIYQGRFG